MSENNCNAAIQDVFNESIPVFNSTLQKTLESSSLGDAQNSAKKLYKIAQSKLDGTYNRDNNFNKEAWNWWNNIYYPMTREKKTEPMDNINNTNLYDSAIKIRHQALRDTNSFRSDCINNVDNVIGEFNNNELNDFYKLKNIMSSLITSYEHLFDYKSSLKAIYNEKFNNLENINNKINTYKQNLFMDERKNNYQSNNYDFYKSAHFFVLIIYFSLLALYLIFSDFIREKRYKERKNIIGLISYIITPFLLAYILDNIYKIYIFILEFNNIRDDVISYPYIVNKFNKTDDEI